MNKICIVTSNIAPYRLKWFEELSKYFNVVVYYTKDKEVDREANFLKHSSDKIKIHKLNNKNDNSDPICFDVIKAINDNKNELILFDGYGVKTNLLGLLYCKLINKKVFVNVDGYALGEKISKIKKAFKRWIVTNLCPYIFCSSESTKKHLIEYGAKANNVYVHNFSSVEEDRIVPKPLTKIEKLSVRKELGINSKKPIIFGCGQFIPRKRFEDLIIAMKSCKIDCDLYILGGKPTKSYIDLVEDRNNIHFLEFVAPELVDKYYQAADVFALTSQTDVWGLVLNEAVAQGLPVISSDNCVAGLSLIDENGVLYKTGDIEQLTKAIEYCLNNEEVLARKSIEIAKKYTIEGMIERQLPILNAYFEGTI